MMSNHRRSQPKQRVSIQPFRSLRPVRLPSLQLWLFRDWIHHHRHPVVSRRQRARLFHAFRKYLKLSIGQLTTKRKVRSDLDHRYRHHRRHPKKQLKLNWNATTLTCSHRLKLFLRRSPLNRMPSKLWTRRNFVTWTKVPLS